MLDDGFQLCCGKEETNVAVASFCEQMTESVAVLRSLQAQSEQIEHINKVICQALLGGQSLFTCGNGGSAADALHLAEEMLCRYCRDRRPLPAVCLNHDVTAMTCIANDFGFAQVFARQLMALARTGDVLVCFSTSGNSPNILAALQVARERGMVGVALLGRDGGEARYLADHAIVVESTSSARIQEAHTLLLHAICEEVEQAIARQSPPDVRGGQ